MSSIADQLRFGAPLMRFKVVLGDFMPILIRHPDNKITLPGEAEITAFRPEMIPFLPAFYTAINAIFGILYGSI
jgi:hypothetical protein